MLVSTVNIKYEQLKSLTSSFVLCSLFSFLLQAQLLDLGCQLVKPNGLLVYSTCSIEPSENEDQIASFLERHSNFELDPPPRSVPEQTLSNGFLRTWPHVHNIDGAFAARLRRTV